MAKKLMRTLAILALVGISTTFFVAFSAQERQSSKIHIEVSQDKISTPLPSNSRDKSPLNPVLPEPKKQDPVQWSWDWQVFREQYQSHYQRTPPERLREWLSFAQDKKCSNEPDFYESIERDLGAFRRLHQDMVKRGLKSATDPVITPDMIELAQRQERIYAIGIHNGQSTHYHPLISSFARHLPNMQIIMNELDEPRVLANDLRHLQPLDLPRLKRKEWTKSYTYGHAGATSLLPLMQYACTDESYHSKAQLHGFFLGSASFSATYELVPIFSSTKVSACFGDIVVPWWGIEDADPGMPEDMDADWLHKTDSLFWRGSTTGGYHGPRNNWKSSHRIRLMSMYGNNSPTRIVTHDMSDKIDMAYSAIIQQANEETETMRNYIGAESPRTSEDDLKNYRYLFDIDGNSYSKRFPRLVNTNAVVFRANIFDDWVTDHVKPWEHYVPVEMDLMGLERQLRWAMNNTEVTSVMRRKMMEHTQKRLRHEDMRCYLYRLLLEYHKLTQPSQ